MKKNESPHKVELRLQEDGTPTGWTCSCAAGKGLCHHVLALLYRLQHYQKLNLKVVPQLTSKTSKPQAWHVPSRTSGVNNRPVQEVTIQRPTKPTAINAEGSREGIASTMYNPVRTPLSEISLPKQLCPYFASVPERSRPQYANLWSVDAELPLFDSQYGLVPKGSLLSYQQPKVKDDGVSCILDPSVPPPPPFTFRDFSFHLQGYLPLPEAKFLRFSALYVTLEQSCEYEENTRLQSASSQWFVLRKHRITATSFKRIDSRRGNFEKLAKDLTVTKSVQTAAMKHGIDNEPIAAMSYSQFFRRNTYAVGFVINPSCPFLGCSPDRRVYDCLEPSPWGLLEIKCSTHESLDKCDFLRMSTASDLNQVEITVYHLKQNHSYYFQIMAQMGISGCSWCDLYVKTIDDAVFHWERIYFDEAIFNNTLAKVVKFFFEYMLSNE